MKLNKIKNKLGRLFQEFQFGEDMTIEYPKDLLILGISEYRKFGAVCNSDDTSQSGSCQIQRIEFKFKHTEAYYSFDLTQNEHFELLHLIQTWKNSNHRKLIENTTDARFANLVAQRAIDVFKKLHAKLREL